VKAKDIENIYGLSPLQQGMLFQTLYAPQSGTYCEQVSFTFRGGIDSVKFKEAWQQVLDRNAVLRTSFHWDGLEKPVQVVHRSVVLPLHEDDWSHLGNADQEARLTSLLESERQRGFSLEKYPLLRMHLIKRGPGVDEFVLIHHHILLDGWSLNMIFEDFYALYSAGFLHGEAKLVDRRPYSDYIGWLQQQDASRAEQFWRGYLNGCEHKPTFRFNMPGRAAWSASSRGDQYEFTLTTETTQAIAAFARHQSLTISTLMQGAWALLLYRYSGNPDVVYGSTVSGRSPELDRVETMVGLFINTLPVRVIVEPETRLIDWLHKIQTQQAEARQYEYSSLVDVQKCSSAPRGHRLFDTILAYENFPISGDSGGAPSAGTRQVHGRTEYPLSVAVAPGPPIWIRMLFNTELFERPAIERMATHLKVLLEGILTDPNRRLAEVSILDEHERNQLLLDWNETAMPFESSRCVYEYVIERAEQKPQNLAIVAGDVELTYAALLRWAHDIARGLRERGVVAGSCVGVCMERSPEMVAGMLGVWLAGGAYVPLDPAYPDQRLGFMREDTGIYVVLCQPHLEARVREYSGPDAAQVIHGPPPNEVRVIDPVAGPRDLAYVIYTSGSTGRPKGVGIEHRSLTNLVNWHLTEYAVGSQDRATQLAGMAYDACVWELWPYLAAGAAVHIIDDEIRTSPSCLRETFLEHRINLSFVPTPLAEELMQLEWPQTVPLRALLTGGDTLHMGAPTSLPFPVVNHYGPTEATVITTCGRVATGPTDNASPSIGRPIANTQTYVLDRDMQPTPIGVAGELFVGGAGLARGYQGRPELTGAQFVTNPFGGPSRRLYRTGDLVSWTASGDLAFHGRIDQQVKIRGFRIELGEVETVIMQHPAVLECSVDARNDRYGGKQLVAYVVPHGLENTETLRAFVAKTVPDFMLPATFVILSKLPLTPNGKVDRRALPDPPDPSVDQDGDSIATTPLEKCLAELWAAVLRLDEVGIDQSFFELGGHSLLATQLVSRIRKTLNIDLPLRCIFEAPTIRLLSRVIDDFNTGRNIDEPAIGVLAREQHRLKLRPEHSD
jgi:amino acid adenylation domain-containing protein